jgi:hypothetical protein
MGWVDKHARWPPRFLVSPGDDEGDLIAIGALDQAKEGEMTAQYIDADAIRIILEDETR